MQHSFGIAFVEYTKLSPSNVSGKKVQLQNLAGEIFAQFTHLDLAPDDRSFGEIRLNKLLPGDFFVRHSVCEEEEQQCTGSEGRHRGVALLVAIIAEATTFCGFKELGKVRLSLTFGRGLGRRCLAPTGALGCGFFWSRCGFLFRCSRWFVFEKLFEALGWFVPP